MRDLPYRATPATSTATAAMDTSMFRRVFFFVSPIMRSTVALPTVLGGREVMDASCGCETEADAPSDALAVGPTLVSATPLAVAPATPTRVAFTYMAGSGSM